MALILWDGATLEVWRHDGGYSVRASDHRGPRTVTGERDYIRGWVRGCVASAYGLGDGPELTALIKRLRVKPADGV